MRALIEDRCDELDLELMVNRNNAAFETPFTVSVDLVGHGCTTGISASGPGQDHASPDRSEHPTEELGCPGHIFPLRAEGVAYCGRAGHTEAAIDLARLAGLEPPGSSSIMNPDGTMARLPELLDIADRFGLRIVSIEDLIATAWPTTPSLNGQAAGPLDTTHGRFTMITYRQTTGDGEHFALTRGEWAPRTTRSRSGCMQASRFDLLGSSHLRRGETLQLALSKLGQMDQGALCLPRKWRLPMGGLSTTCRKAPCRGPFDTPVGEAELQRRHG